MLLVAANKKFWELLLEMGMTNLELEVGNEERQGIAEEWMWCREWFGSSEAGESMVLGKKSVSSEPTHFDSRAGRIESSPIERTCPGGGERDADSGVRNVGGSWEKDQNFGEAQRTRTCQPNSVLSEVSGCAMKWTMISLSD